MAKSIAVTEQCPMEIGLNVLSGKWKLKILWQISKGAVRFNELQRRLGKITTKTLTQQLRELEVQKIIQRTVYPENPPKVEYALTELALNDRVDNRNRKQFRGKHQQLVI